MRVLDYDLVRASKLNHDVVHPETGAVLVKKGKKLHAWNIRRMKEAGVTHPR